MLLCRHTTTNPLYSFEKESFVGIVMIECEEEFEVQEILNHTPACKTRTDTGNRYLAAPQLVRASS